MRATRTRHTSGHPSHRGDHRPHRRDPAETGVPNRGQRGNARPRVPREVLAVDTVVRLIRHYTADHPGLLLSDPESATAVRTLLEAFIRLGWDQAITLKVLADMMAETGHLAR